MAHPVTKDECVALAAEVLIGIRDEMQAAGVTLDDAAAGAQPTRARENAEAPPE